MKLQLSPISKYYIAAALLTNIHTCLYGSQTGAYFNCVAPSVESYLA